jgi:hypothetical protein
MIMSREGIVVDESLYYDDDDKTMMTIIAPKASASYASM